MEQEPAQELLDRQSHHTLSVFVSGIAPAESNAALVEGDEAVVGDGHAMSVLAEIAKRMVRAAEGTFRVHHPFGAEQRTQPRREHLWILKRSQRAVEVELVPCVQILEALHELAPEHFFENLDGQEESLLRVDPPGVVRSQTAGGNHTVNVRMKQQPPTVP
jgi:hypothetical protein